MENFLSLKQILLAFNRTTAVRQAEDLQVLTVLLSPTHLAEDVHHVFWSFKGDKPVSEEKTETGGSGFNPGAGLGRQTHPLDIPERLVTIFTSVTVP